MRNAQPRIHRYGSLSSPHIGAPLSSLAWFGKLPVPKFMPASDVHTDTQDLILELAYRDKSD